MSESTSPTTNGTNRITETDPVTDAWTRYEGLKTIENEKDNFIKVRVSGAAQPSSELSIHLEIFDLTPTAQAFGNTSLRTVENSAASIVTSKWSQILRPRDFHAPFLFT